MPTIQIPVSEVRKGDVLDIAGVKFAVEYDYDPRCPRSVLAGDGGVSFPDGATIVVDRPDPDAELIEAMLSAWGEMDECDTEDMRRVLAAVREWDARAGQ